jgi:hypothetical protein
LGRLVRTVGAVNTMDERLLDRLRQWTFARDELGAQLVMVIRPMGRPDRSSAIRRAHRGPQER